MPRVFRKTCLQEEMKRGGGTGGTSFWCEQSIFSPHSTSAPYEYPYKQASDSEAGVPAISEEEAFRLFGETRPTHGLSETAQASQEGGKGCMWGLASRERREVNVGGQSETGSCRR